MSSERYLVLGTAGHIDHGKTSLVRALTGIETDRLAEEKARGITIDLGFASWTLPDGTRLGVIDVPGHKRFIRNMVAGAAGIDLIMLVVAADDGVMPQTIEHLQIARLLGVQHGLIALTKADMVEPELLELARSDVEALVAGTFLAGAPIVPVSSITGEGIDALTAATAELAARVQLPESDAPLRLPIDRAFSIRGAGTVVTGTLIAGTVRVDDELAVMPADKRVRVRSLQLHSQSTASIGPRHRAALNLVGIEKDELHRGDVLATPDSLIPTALFDARVELLPGKLRPLRHGSWVEVHIGTAETGAKIVPLESEAAAPGTTALVQLKLDNKLALAAGDRFILRGSTGDQTIGGGVVLDAHPTLHRRSKRKAADDLAELADVVGTQPVAESGKGQADTTPREPITALLLHEVAKAPWGLSRHDAARLLNVGEVQAAAAALRLAQTDAALRVHRERGEMYTLPENRARIGAQVERALAGHHAAHPLRRRGLTAAEVAQAISGVTGRLGADAVRAVLEELLAAETLKQVDDSYALKAHAPKINAREEQAAAELARRLEASLTPEQPDEAMAEVGLTKERLRHVLDYMREERLAVLAPGGIWFGAGQVEAAKAAVRERLAGGGGLTVSDFNGLLGTSRKYGIPLLQLLENDGMLVRDGDLRRLKG